MAGAYPAMRLGAPWWFLDSPAAMRRFRESVTETAGFYNTSGFVDDTRAFSSIPARHDVARRVEAAISQSSSYEASWAWTRRRRPRSTSRSPSRGRRTRAR